MIVLLMVLFSPYGAIAHSDLTDRIEVLNHKINHNPESLALYMERGKIFRLRGNYQYALKDFQQVAKMEPSNIEAKYQQGLVLLNMGQPQKSLSMFNHVLKTNPTHPMALVNRARVFRSAENYENATADYVHALTLLSSPKPENYIELANIYIAFGESHYDDALSVLDSARQKLGILVQLQARAIDIDLLMKNKRSALQRVDLLLTTMKRKEKWLVKKADILLLMGKQAEATDNYRMALKSIEKLPRARRNVEAIKTLEENIRQSLLDINSGKT